MKPVQGSPVSSTMQEAFGCAVENRFFQLLDDESDPLDYLYQATSDLGKGKKKEEAAGKKAGNQKSNKKESQKDRKIVVIANTEAPEAPKQRAPKQSMPKVPQNENSGPEVKVERSERRAVFREFRPNVIEKPLEYSVDDFEKEKQVRNWVSNQRGGTRGRGRGAFPRNMENDQRGKREFDRHSGSDRSGIKAEDKRGGGGPRNWGSFRDACSDVDPTPVENVEAMEPVEATTEEGQDVKAPEDYSEDYLREMSLDEWKSIQDQSRPKVELNLRKPDTSVPSKARVIHKSKYVNNSKEDDEFNIGFRKPVNDITAQLEINFGSLPRPGRGGRGGGRGRVRREEPFPHEGHNVHEFVLNPDDPEDFPALT